MKDKAADSPETLARCCDEKSDYCDDDVGVVAGDG